MTELKDRYEQKDRDDRDQVFKQTSKLNDIYKNIGELMQQADENKDELIKEMINEGLDRNRELQ